MLLSYQAHFTQFNLSSLSLLKKQQTIFYGNTMQCSTNSSVVINTYKKALNLFYLYFSERSHHAIYYLYLITCAARLSMLSLPLEIRKNTAT